MPKRTPYTLFLTILFVSQILLFFPVYTLAENTDPDISFNLSLLDLTLEELTMVTVVSLFEETQLDTSSSVYILNEEEWRRKGARRTDEVISYQPGAINLTVLGGASGFPIRGYANSLSARGVATLLDGVPLNTFSFGTAQYFLFNFDLGALNRVELIRGPGSAIHGSDAFHGVFALQTFSSQEDTVDSCIGIGSPEYSRFHTRMSYGLTEDHRLHFAVGGTHQGGDDISFDDPNSTAKGLRQNAYSSQTMVLKSDHTINANWTSHFGLYYNNINTQDFHSFGANTLGVDDISDDDSDFYMVTAEAVRSLSKNKTLELKTYHWQSDQKFLYEFTPVPWQSQKDQRQGMSITLKQPGNENKLRWLIGAETSRQKIVSAGTPDGPQAFDGLDRTINDIFSEVRIPFFNNQMAFLMGARLDDYSDFGTQFTPRLSYIYKPVAGMALKLLYGNAFRAPIGSELTSSGVFLGDPNIKPETIDTYEAILMHKTENSHASLTVFFSEWKDAIIVVGDDTLPAPFTSRYSNEGVFKSKGVELEYSLNYDVWSLESGISFIKSENEDTDETFVAFPETIVNVSLGYSIPSLYTAITFANQAWFNVHANPAQSSDKLSTIWLNNLNISYSRSANLEFALDIRDVFDRNDALPSLWGNPQGVPGNGREFAAYIRMKW